MRAGCRVFIVEADGGKITTLLYKGNLEIAFLLYNKSFPIHDDRSGSYQMPSCFFFFYFDLSKVIFNYKIHKVMSLNHKKNTITTNCYQ